MLSNQQLLEHNDRHCAMPERLTRAAARVGVIEGGAVEGSVHTLRAEQVGVYTDFAEFLTDAATAPQSFRLGMPTGRIVLPPRTGKTVLAGQIIVGAGMMCTFIVPTRTLVLQTARDLAEQLPGVPIGTYSGELKELVMYGVNVTTYQILQSDLSSKGQVPAPIALSSLVFADEGHHAMTKDRQKVLREAFDPLAVRVALTATPNYSEARRLVNYFERAIHEITITEAVELEMVAPLRIWIAEVDVDASRVQMKAGDFDEVELGRVMGDVTFFEATKLFRYTPENRQKRALICCVTRQQAYDLQEYLKVNRPVDAPLPAVIVGETTGREKLLSQFNEGEIDTLISVGVLIEGWNAPVCKLLIDLSPAHSWVRATQKFFRPMTKRGDEEAHIYMLIPAGLPELPVLPMDLFDWNQPEYQQGELIASKRRRSQAAARPIHPHTHAVEKVVLRSSIIFAGLLEKSKLNPTRSQEVEEVLLTNQAITREKIPGYNEFRNLIFEHPLFKGRGANLLRYCNIRNRFAYVRFMARFFLEGASELYMSDRNYLGATVQVQERSCADDLAFMNAQLIGSEGNSLNEDFEHGWIALGCHLQDGEPLSPSAEDDYLRHRKFPETIRAVMATLSHPREERVLRMWFGIDEPARNQAEFGEIYRVGNARIQQLVARAVRHLKHPSRQSVLKEFEHLLY